MRKLVLFVFCLGAALSVISCETLKGMGQDLENTGENIQEAAQKLDKKAEEEPIN